MARSIYFPLFVALAIFAFVHAVPVSETRPERGDIPDEELYPQAYPERGDIPDEELYPSEDEEAEIAKFKDDLKETWEKVKAAIKSKSEEVIKDAKIRKSVEEIVNKLIDKVKHTIEKILEKTREKLNTISDTDQLPAVPPPDVFSARNNDAEDAWNAFKKWVSDQYKKIKEDPQVKKSIEDAKKAIENDPEAKKIVEETKKIAKDIIDEIRKQLGKTKSE